MIYLAPNLPHLPSTFSPSHKMYLLNLYGIGSCNNKSS